MGFNRRILPPLSRLVELWDSSPDFTTFEREVIGKTDSLSGDPDAVQWYRKLREQQDKKTESIA